MMIFGHYQSRPCWAWGATFGSPPKTPSTGDFEFPNLTLYAYLQTLPA